jgi:UDP-N-acetylmuramate dehydrogenase
MESYGVIWRFVLTRLDELTTLRLGGPIRRIEHAKTACELIDAVRSADAAGEPLLIVGGGSNLVAADAGWDGVVVLVESTGVDVQGQDDTVCVTAQAGVVWDELVAQSVGSGWSGLAAMSGIPGLTGATPVQNVGAYGSEVADSIVELQVLDRNDGVVRPFAPEQCGFAFRTSAFKHTDRFVVLEVTFRLRRSPDSVPVRYAELARRLGIEPGRTASSAAVRDVVLELRRSKGMLLDASDHDTWSVGSFFVNPVVASSLAPRGCPQWTVDGQVKLSGAWLIENSGFQRGYGLARGSGQVAISTKHALALTNRGGATTSELLGLAAEIRAGVEHQFGVRLRPEAHLKGVTF